MTTNEKDVRFAHYANEHNFTNALGMVRGTMTVINDQNIRYDVLTTVEKDLWQRCIGRLLEANQLLMGLITLNKAGVSGEVKESIEQEAWEVFNEVEDFCDDGC
jgi:hypothetical protein